MTSNAVNRPTDIKQKEQDVNQKLQLYGIYTAFANGKVPSNKQVDVALNSALASRPLSNPSERLSEEGRKLVGDLRDVIEQAKLLILSKNEGNLLQDFIWQCQQIDAGNAKLPGAAVDKDTAQQHGNQALEGLRTLGTLLITNGQFRKLLSDAAILFRDMAGDAASSAASRLKPSEDQLSQIDHPAEDNIWHDTPNLSKENIKAQIKNQYSTQKPVSTADAKDTAAEASQASQPTEGAQIGANSLQSKVSENVPEETKNRSRRYLESSKNYLSEKVSQERREKTTWRLKKMIVEIQGHPDYQRAIETLLSLAETYSGHASTVTQQGVGTVKGAHEDNSLNAAEADIKVRNFFRFPEREQADADRNQDSS